MGALVFAGASEASANTGAASSKGRKMSPQIMRYFERFHISFYGWVVVAVVVEEVGASPTIVVVVEMG